MSLFRIVVQMRDEAHRFSRKLHHKAEKKRIIHSWLDDVKGLNQKLKKEIQQKNIYSHEELKKLNISEIQNFFGVELKHARIIYNHLHAEEKSN